MLLINCPWCGERDMSEFTCRGEAHIARAPDPNELNDAQWGDYLFFRANPKGAHRERWVHTHGCRRWFVVARDTRSDKIFASYWPGQPPPPIPGDES